MCDVSACCDPWPNPGGRINHPFQGVKMDRNSWANITGFEQVFLLLVYKDVERYKMAWAWTNRKVPFWNQAAGIPSIKNGRTNRELLPLRFSKSKRICPWFADKSPCGRWSAYWKKVCLVQKRAEFPIATVDYKSVFMSCLKMDAKIQRMARMIILSPNRFDPSPPCPWPSLPSQHEQQSIAPGTMLIWWLSETI